MRENQISRELLAALMLGILGSTLFTPLSKNLHNITSLYLIITLISGLYIFYLLKFGKQNTGVMTTTVVWCLFSTSLFIWQPPLSFYLIINTLSIWLIRSIYYHQDFTQSFIDLGLISLSLLIAYSLLIETQNLFIFIFSFFSTQSLYITLHHVKLNLNNREKNETPLTSPHFLDSALRKNQISLIESHNDRFRQAYLSAESAIEHLIKKD